MRSHRVQQSQITTPTGSIPNAYTGYLRISDPVAVFSHHSHDISVALAILLLKNHQNEVEYIITIHLRVIFHL